jgi:hypothetical protein
MLRFVSLAILGATLFAAFNLNAEEYVWGKEHPEAKERLLKIFEKHEGFREALTTLSVEHHSIFTALVDYLAENKEHTVEEFIRKREREDKETGHLQKTHDKYKEGMLAFREWVRDHKDAAVALTRHERELEHLDRVAEKHDR